MRSTFLVTADGNGLFVLWISFDLPTSPEHILPNICNQNGQSCTYITQRQGFDLIEVGLQK